MPKTAAIVVSDLHINNTVALCAPTVNLDDGGTYRASRTQRALLDAFQDFAKTVQEFNMRKVLFLNGDIGELDTKRRSVQLVTPNKAVIMRMILDVLNPLIDVVDSVVVLRGTAAHTGKSSWLEESLAEDLDHSVHNKEAASWWHFRGKIENVTFDIAHHASMGSLPWTEKNAAIKVAKIITDRYNEMQAPPPQVAFRAHNHRRSDSGRNFQTKAICGPSWSSKTEHVYRIAHENDISDIGGDVVVCEKGKYEWIDYRYHPLPEGRRVWSIKI